MVVTDRERPLDSLTPPLTWAEEREGDYWLSPTGDHVWLSSLPQSSPHIAESVAQTGAPSHSNL